MYDVFIVFFPDISTGMLQFCSPSTLQTIDISIVFASGNLTQTQDIPNTHTHIHDIYIYGEWPGLIATLKSLIPTMSIPSTKIC